MCSFWASLLKIIVTLYMYSTSTGAGDIPRGAVLPILCRFSVLSFTVHLWRLQEPSTPYNIELFIIYKP